MTHIILAILLATPVYVVTPRGNEAVKFAHTVPMPKKCYDAKGKIKTRIVKFASGPIHIRDCVVDHIKALRCGGADAMSNMQWQTYAESVAKDKIERKCQ